MNRININENIFRQLKISKVTDEVYVSNGLKKHLIKSNHENILGYFENDLENILLDPDYVGRNPNIKGVSLECIKVLDDNVLVAVKLDVKRDYYYVASMYEITDSKLQHIKRSQRIRKFDNDTWE